MSAQRARQVFADAIDKAPADRAGFLASACGDDQELRARVEQLLSAHDAALAACPERATGAEPAGEQAGERIGHYKLLEVIGTGGFGTVWMAEQHEPVRRKVALKILKLGMDTRQVVARFEAERQALALMDHPHIAKVFDGGSTERGRPYFVMELVKGLPITKFCDEARLSTKDRLALFQRVCEAVQHAHQKGVVHRDIKPSNVLVTLHDGRAVPKVIDFGIAKAMQSQLTDKTVFTGFKQMLGTPEYMAPEQAETSGLDVDTRADIYSLGVLLYELMTGTKPFELATLLQVGYAEMLRTLKEVDPEKPSTRISTLGDRLAEVALRRRVHPRSFGSLVRGDLDWIIMRAMEKDRSRRYPTALALSEDVERHLGDVPVLAGPPSRLYRLRKYVCRHRVGVAAVVMIGLALLGGATAAGWGYLSATRAAETSARQALKSQRLASLLESLLASADPHEKRGRGYKVEELLAEFERELACGLQAEPEVSASLHATLGRSLLGLGLTERAAPALQKSLELRESRFGPTSLEYAESLHDQAQLAHDRSQWSKAEDLCREALAIHGQPGRGASLSHLKVLRTLGDLLRHRGRLPEADTSCTAALEMARELFGKEHGEVAESLGALAAVIQERDLCKAERIYGEALAMLRDLGEGESLEAGGQMGWLAAVLCDQGRTAEAEQLQQKALAITRGILGEDHPGVANSMIRLGSAQLASGDVESAEASYQAAIAICTRAKAEDSAQMTRALAGLAQVAGARGDLGEAERLQRRVVAIDLATLGATDPATLTSQHNLSIDLAKRGDFAAAQALAEETLRARIALFDEVHLHVAFSRNGLGSILARRGDPEASAREHAAALAIQTQILGAGHWSTAKTLGNLGSAQWQLGKVQDAVVTLQSGLGILERHGRGETADAAHILWSLACLRMEAGDLGPAGRDLGKAREIWGKQKPSGPDDVAKGLDAASGLEDLLGHLDAAERLMAEALELRLKGSSAGDPNVAYTQLRLGKFLVRRGELDRGEPLLREGAAVLLAKLGDRHPWVADAYDELGQLARARGDWRAEDEALQKALAIRERRFGPNAPCLMGVLNNLGLSQIELGKFDAAEATLGRALRICDQAGGRTPIERAFLLNSIGVLWSKRGSADRALEYLRQALQELDQQKRDLHPDEVVILENLADSLEQKDPIAAEALYQRGLEVRLRHFGDQHRTVARSLCSLGFVSQIRGQRELALERFRKGLAIRRKALAAGHPDLVENLSFLASTLASQADGATEAEALFTEALEQERDHGGRRNSESLAGILGWLGKLAETRGDLPRAVDCLRQAARGFSALENQTFETPVAFASLGRCLSACGDAAGALAAKQQELAAWQKVPNAHHSAIENAELALAGMLRDQGRPAEAEACLSAQLERRRTRLPAGDPGIAETLAALGRCLLRQDRGAAAEPLLRECLRIREERLPDDYRRFAAMSLLGEALLAKGLLAEAESLLVEGTEKLASSKASMRIKKEAKERLVLLLEHQEQLAKTQLARGDAAGAEALQQRGTEVRRRCFGDEPAAVARVLHELGQVARTRGEHETATARLRQSLAIRRQVLAAGHPDLAVSMWELAETLASRDEGAAEAEALFTEALEHEGDHGGRRDSESLAGILDWLGTLAEKRCDLPRAADFARQAVAVFEARKDAEGKAAITLGRLGRYLDASGDAAGALAVRQKEKLALGQQLAHRRTQLPAGDPRIAETLAALASCLLRQDQASVAEPLLLECLRIREQRLPDDYRRFQTMSLLGEAWLAQGRLAEAETLLCQAAEKLSATKASLRIRREAVQRVVQLFEKQKRPDLAKEWSQKLRDLEPPK